MFSALDLARTDANYVVLAGPHPQCPGTTPAPVPAGAADMRRVAVQPRPQDVTSCIDWWTVDLFVGRDGRVRFVTIDVGSP